MAKLIRQTGDDPGDVIELKAGVNSFGTSNECDFIVDHSSVSPYHCELIVDKLGLTVRDLNSLNGTFVDESPVAETHVRVGQTIRMGEVELLLADDKLAATRRLDGSLTQKLPYCARHPDKRAAFRCPDCGAVMCVHCVHVIKLQGGSGMFLCPRCSKPCESLRPMDDKARAKMIDQLSMVRTLFAPRSSRPDRPQEEA